MAKEAAKEVQGIRGSLCWGSGLIVHGLLSTVISNAKLGRVFIKLREILHGQICIMAEGSSWIPPWNEVQLR